MILIVSISTKTTLLVVITMSVSMNTVSGVRVVMGFLPSRQGFPARLHGNAGTGSCMKFKRTGKEELLRICKEKRYSSLSTVSLMVIIEL